MPVGQWSEPGTIGGRDQIDDNDFDTIELDKSGHGLIVLQIE